MMVALRSLSRPTAVGLALLALCLAGSLGAYGLTPRTMAASARAHSLESLVPERFGDWQRVEAARLILPDPAADALQNRLYTEMLARAYTRADGAVVMLVIAWGGDQSDDLQLHRPEVCYAANGFKVGALGRVLQTIDGERLLLTRLATRDTAVREPVTYWMRVGHRIVASTLDRQWVKLRASLSGTVPDGVLVRISSRGPVGAPTDFSAHDDFLEALIPALDPEARALLIADGAPPGEGA